MSSSLTYSVLALGKEPWVEYTADFTAFSRQDNPSYNVGLHNITFFTQWYIITNDITISQEISVCISASATCTCICTNWAKVSPSFATALIVVADVLDDHACPCLASFYLQVRIRMPILQMAVEIGSVSILGCHFLLTYVHFGRSGDRGLPFLSTSNPKCFQTGAMVFRLATSSTLASVLSSSALADSIDTGLLLIAILKAGHVH